MLKESDIIVGLKNGERFAFDWVYQHCFAKATSYLRQHRGNAQDAEDYFQEALFVLVKKLRDPEFELTASCSTFLYTVVRNLWLYHQRKAGRVISTQENQFLYLAESAGMAFWQLGEEKAEQAEQIEQVKSAFSGLSEECRQFLLLNYFEYKEDAEIANMMNYSLEFVKVKRFRCLKKLKEILGL